MPVEQEQLRWSAVVVNFRRYDLLASCIDALVASSAPPNEVIVVDNASDSPKLAELTARYPTVRVIANESNLGYAAACNQGWRASGQDLVLFVNPDVTVGRDTVPNCIRALATESGAGAATCRLVLPDGRLDHACHRGIPTPSASLAYTLRLNRLFPKSRLLARYTMSWLDPLTDHDVEACSGAFMLVWKRVLAQVGGWDERYWFYGEDLDLCLRIGRVGKRIRYVGTVAAVHLKGTSSHLRQPTRGLSPRQRDVKRNVRAAIIESHRRFYGDHFEGSTWRPMSLMIRGMFTAQRLRLALINWLDSVRGM